MNCSSSPITAFYKNRCVFITGATGFLGKAIVEKLIRTCSDIEAVYILIRPKKGSDIKSRLKELLESSIFNIIKQKDAELLKKIIPIEGDITLPNLGISENDKQTLTEKVSVIIHSAATVKFDEKLKLSAEINIQGSQRIVELCKRIKNLIALVHVSTAYANCEREEIDEVVYPPPADPTELLQRLEGMNDEEIEKSTPQLIGNKPNTYTFTKAIAEHILTEEAKTLPICIVRPSIVAAAWKEPVPSWVDNMNAATGTITAFTMGILRTAMINGKYVADLIPLDFTVNLILTGAWHIAEKKPKELKVYNCCTGTENPLLWRQVKKWVLNYMKDNPLSGEVWYPVVTFATNEKLNQINDLFLHFIPAYMMDKVAILTGRKPVMLKLYRKVTNALKPLQYFSTKQWKFETGNMVALHRTMSLEDQRMFCFNVKDINWPIYFEKYCFGIRKYALKDDESTLPIARKHLWKLYYVHMLIKLVLILMVFGIFMLAFRFV